ncbi:TMEM45B [Branchiostoma lanceolatum]|uniref:TMEM45B protein n=1 Tax=Branchiostoma lanceolatum TaxID=7740 RepID=A0A8J9ZNJ7_BRALA|nr:TMEM45B [Branchiostoma lanceolatum]
MGNFIGHAAPGSFFLLFGLWWTIKYSVMRASRQGGGKTSSAHTACCCRGPVRFLEWVPIEGLCKIMFTCAAIVPTVAVTGLETWKPRTVYLPMLRAALVLLQGTWLWQVGFILYPPFPGHEWNLENQENMMFVSMAFCWHILGILLFMCVVYTIVYRIYQAKEEHGGTKLELGMLFSHMLQTHSDSDLD